MENPSVQDPEERKHPLLDNDCNQVPSLLTLSRADLTGKQQNDNGDSESDSLVLMQLPPSMNIADLKSARIVAPADRQACLVIENTGQSFGISRVDTSNALILVPPCLSAKETEPILQSPPPSKRAKTTNLLPLPARLLQPGSSESSFLELKDRVLDVKELKQQLKDFVFSPYTSDNDTHWKGKTLQELAMTMQYSERQILEGLTTIGAFGMPQDEGNEIGYGLLSEEATQQALQAMIATLTECDEFSDFEKGPVSVKALIDETAKRVESDEDATYPKIYHVVRHCLKSLVDTNMQPEETTVQLDFDKVARCVAHDVFRSQSEAWDESSFLTRWHSVLPSVNKAPSMDLLKGIAVEICTLSGDHRWKYFPHDKLSSDPGARFQQLFAVKERWTLEEISPYLKFFGDDLGMSQSHVLSVHARSVTEVVDGVSTKYYLKL